jgi:hypothetical protein
MRSEITEPGVAYVATAEHRLAGDTEGPFF